MMTTTMVKVKITLVSDSEKEGHRKRHRTLPPSHLSRGLFVGTLPAKTHLNECGKKGGKIMDTVARDFGAGVAESVTKSPPPLSLGSQPRPQC